METVNARLPFAWLLVLLLGVPGASMALERLEPASGLYVGMFVEQGSTSLADFEAETGIDAASYVFFSSFPLDETSEANLRAFLQDTGRLGAIALITLEPHGGLGEVTPAECDYLVSVLAGYDEIGAKIMIRFAHEMNGSWYPWAQQPALYIEKYRLLAGAIHGGTQNVAMVWAPNTGNGYPFSDGAYVAQPGSTEFAAMDTDGDGDVDMSDDMFSPFYPGDAYVDWVGLTLYHLDKPNPFGNNEVPADRKLTDIITGNYYIDTGYDYTEVLDFYALFCAESGHGKPLMIAETAAMFNPYYDYHIAEESVKHAWIDQLFNVSGDTSAALDVSVHYPKLKMVNWFDEIKVEDSLGGFWVDWRLSANATVLNYFENAVSDPYFLHASDLSAAAPPGRSLVFSPGLPGQSHLWATANYAIYASSLSDADLCLQLIKDGVVYGEGRVALGAGTAGFIDVPVTISNQLSAGFTMAWRAFLVPPGGDANDPDAIFGDPMPVYASYANQPPFYELDCEGYPRRLTGFSASSASVTGLATAVQPMDVVVEVYLSTGQYIDEARTRFQGPAINAPYTVTINFNPPLQTPLVYYFKTYMTWVNAGSSQGQAWQDGIWFYFYTPDAYDVWWIGQLGDTGYSVSGPETERTADYDSDQLPNIMEYAFGADPVTPDYAAPSQLTVMPDGGGGSQWSFIYTRRTDIGGVSFEAQTSTDMVNWSPLSESAATITNLGGNREELVFTQTTPGPPVFFRLQVQ